MLYNPAWAYHYAVNYAWLAFVGSLIILGFLAQAKLKSRILMAGTVGALAVLALGFLPRPDRPEVVVFQARELPSTTGRIEKFTRVAEQGSDLPGFVNYGPYFPLRKGRFRLTIKFSSRAPAEQVVGKCDISDFSAGREVAEYSLHGTAGSLKSFEEAFVVDDWAPHLYEFRNYWNGVSEFEIHEIVLEHF